MGNLRKWQIEDSAELYNIRGWGIDYFGINDDGNVEVTPLKGCKPVVIKDVIEQLARQDVGLPLLLRFPDILDSRIEELNECFQRASKEYDYKAKNYIIYPIKVNQMRPVVEEMVRHGKRFNFGLEAGSKPELHAVIAQAIDENALIICNGYKDANYIELALLAKKMGRQIFIVVEKLSELFLVADISARLHVKPYIGIRIKLASSGSGKWEDSGGDESKFGLTTSELVDALNYLRENNLSDCLRLLHFHIGSQVTKIRSIKAAIQEASQFYVQVRHEGFAVDFVDIGGGLGVDYDGTRSSRTGNSMNYSIQEYVNDAVCAIVDASDKNELPHPNIVTESGRAICAHHSVLVFKAIGATCPPTWSDDNELPPEANDLLVEMHGIYNDINVTNLLESWHDAQQDREEALSTFTLGHMDINTRAMVEKLFWAIARKVVQIASTLKHAPEELQDVQRLLSFRYFCNFSLFQSLPDSWAIDQVFPVMPIHRLKEKPDCEATIQDITCDSDGKIENFVSHSNRAYCLPVHALRPGEPYYIGVFLVGAYQEILGDMHNLFGDTNVVHITVDKDSYHIDQVIDGETVAEVLEYVQYESKKLVRTVEKWVAASEKDQLITPEEGREFLSNYRSGLYGYTYLEL